MIKRSLAAAFLLFISPPSWAESYWYYTTAVGKARIELKLPLHPALVAHGFYVDKEEISSTRHFGGGYRVNEHIAVESSYNDLGTYLACLSHVLVGRLVCANGSAESYSVGVVGYMDSVYARVDYHVVEATGYFVNRRYSIKDGGYTGGVGVSVPITPKMSLRYEMHYPSVPKWQMGLEVKF